MVSPLLIQMGLPVLSEVLREALGTLDHPAARGVVNALQDFDKAMIAGQMDIEQLRAAHSHAEKMTELKLTARKNQLDSTQQIMQQELAAQDKYVRRMRPTFGYFMAVTWAAQMLALSYIMVFRTDQAHLVIEAMESLSMIWAVGLSVLGIYVYKRSEDKKTLSERTYPQVFSKALPMTENQDGLSPLSKSEGADNGNPPRYNE